MSAAGVGREPRTANVSGTDQCALEAGSATAAPLTPAVSPPELVVVSSGSGASTPVRTNCLNAAPADHGLGLQPSELSQCAAKPMVAVPSLLTAFVIS